MHFLTNRRNEFSSSLKRRYSLNYKKERQKHIFSICVFDYLTLFVFNLIGKLKMHNHSLFDLQTKISLKCQCHFNNGTQFFFFFLKIINQITFLHSTILFSGAPLSEHTMNKTINSAKKSRIIILLSSTEMSINGIGETATAYIR